MFDDSEPTSLGSELRRASYIDFTKYKRKQAILKTDFSERKSKIFELYKFVFRLTYNLQLHKRY